MNITIVAMVIVMIVVIAMNCDIALMENQDLQFMAICVISSLETISYLLGKAPTN